MDAQPATSRRWLSGARAHRRPLIAGLMWLALLAFALQVYLGGLVPEFLHRTGIHAVERMGGYCSTESPYSGRDMLDEHVNTVFLRRAAPESFDDLEELGRFPVLRQVYLRNSSVTDADLRHLSGMQRLTLLDASYTEIGDEGFRVIGTLTGLRSLEARETRVTDVGLSHLAHCSSLESVTLAGNRIHGKGFAHLVDTPIEILLLAECDLRDLTHIAGMRSLTHLDISNCQLDDEALAPLHSASQIETLYVYGNPLTDRCLEHIAAMERLRIVGLSDTGVTDEGLQKLKQQRPQLKTHRDFMGDNQVEWRRDQPDLRKADAE